jgi:hypothetical protein
VRDGLAWLALLLLALLMLAAGFQGSLGRLVAVVFVPGQLVEGDSEATNSDGGKTTN